MLIYKTSLHDALYRHVEENVNPELVITEPGESNLYFLSGTVVLDDGLDLKSLVPTCKTTTSGSLPNVVCQVGGGGPQKALNVDIVFGHKLSHPPTWIPPQ